MLTRIKVAGTEAWENIEVESITLKMGTTLTGTIKAIPNERAGELLRESGPYDFEFSRSSDDDSDVISISGMVVRSCEIGAGVGYEVPVDAYEFDAEDFNIID